MTGAWAQTTSHEASSVTVERSTEGLSISTHIREPLSPSVQDALKKGVPLYFVWSAEVKAPRWYAWRDRTVAQATRTLRLAYQPLSQQWRLSWSNQAASVAGLNQAVHHNHASLDEAWQSVVRMAHWPVATAQALPEHEGWVQVSFRLDLSLLPRPFQLGLSNQSDWVMGLDYRLPVPPVGTNVETRYAR